MPDRARHRRASNGAGLARRRAAGLPGRWAALLGILALLTQSAALLVPMPAAGMFGVALRAAATPCHDAGAQQPIPRDHHSDRWQHVCPICQSLHLAGTFLLPSAAVAVTRAPAWRAQRPLSAAGHPTFNAFGRPQPRAPPARA